MHWVFEQVFNSLYFIISDKRKMKESSAGENITNLQRGEGGNSNNPSTHNTTSTNEGSNIDTGDSTITTAAEDG